MSNQKMIIESLAMDLLRVAIGLHRGSLKMAERFRKEALRRGIELEGQPMMNDYLKKLLQDSRKILYSNSERTAEDALMYSILFQNFVRKNFN